MPKAKSKTDKTLYCLCREPNDTTRAMVQCGFCDDWFHPSCVGLDEDEAEAIAHWNCPGCVDAISQNPNLSRKSLLSFQGRIAPKSGWNNAFAIQEIDESIFDGYIKTKRHRIEGYNLCHEGKVLSLASTSSPLYIFFKADCSAAMKDQKYAVVICLKNGGKKIKWGTCTCPAGIDGECKHVVAVLYFIIDLFRKDVTSIPDIQTCTDKLQMWHVRKPLTDEPLLFNDISFVKHDPFHVAKRELCVTVKSHNPVPDFAKCVTKSKIEKLVNLFEAPDVSLPVIETFQSNSCQPAVRKEQSFTNLSDPLFQAVFKNKCSFDVPELRDDQLLFYSSHIAVDSSSSQLIENCTRMQSKNARWFQERRYRITSSNFGTFGRLKESTDAVKTFKQKQLYFTSKSVKHGVQYEDMAFAKYMSLNEVTDSSVGLVINPSMPFLGASPDRLVMENGSLKLIEIKCPFSIFQKKTSLKNCVKDRSFYLTESGGRITLKTGHDYYFQIQGQLNICGIQECDLVVFVPPDDIVVVTIQRDEVFFNSLLQKLGKIWFEKLLPYFSQSTQIQDL